MPPAAEPLPDAPASPEEPPAAASSLLSASINLLSSVFNSYTYPLHQLFHRVAQLKQLYPWASCVSMQTNQQSI